MSTFVLVIIACISMTVGNLPFAITFSNPTILQALLLIGKIYFPILAFIIVEGYLHEKDFAKYLTRICVFALISQVFSILLFKDNLTSLYFNEFFTLSLGLLGVRVLDKVKHKFLAWPVLILFALLAQVLGFDYGLVGILLIASYFVFRTKPVKASLVQTLLFFVLYFEKCSRLAFNLLNLRFILLQFAFSIIGLMIVSFYRKWENDKNVKLGFYCFYPLHLAVLALIKFIF